MSHVIQLEWMPYDANDQNTWPSSEGDYLVVRGQSDHLYTARDSVYWSGHEFIVHNDKICFWMVLPKPPTREEK